MSTLKVSEKSPIESKVMKSMPLNSLWLGGLNTFFPDRFLKKSDRSPHGVFSASDFFFIKLQL